LAGTLTTFATRLLQSLVVLLLVSVLVFALARLVPGDPVKTLLGFEGTQTQIDEMRETLGLNRPLPVQYVAWLGEVLSGDFGRSITYREPVADLLLARLPVTALLGTLAFVLAVVLGIVAGVVAAVYRGTPVDGLVTVLATIGLATPVFWLGVLFIYLFSLKLGWLPVQGFTSPFVDPARSLQQLVLPVVCLALSPLASIARQTRSSVLEVIQQDYVRTAWSKGLRERAIIVGHVLRNALMPIVTLTGVHLNHLLGGSVLVETVFNIPGLGRLIVNAVFDKDFQVVQSSVLVFAVIVVTVNLLIDYSYAFIDPRTRR